MSTPLGTEETRSSLAVAPTSIRLSIHKRMVDAGSARIARNKEREKMVSFSLFSHG